jgi:hypothetical protein
MKKLFGLSVAVTVSVCFIFANASADSSILIWDFDDEINICCDKAEDPTKGCPVDSICPTDPEEWTEVFSETIKVPFMRKTLIINVSLECELKTNTLSLTPPKSEANAKVVVHVLIDGEEADPGEVTFARRFQALIHNKPPDSSSPPPATLHNAVVVLYGTTANSFNFVYGDVPFGTHTIKVEAKVVPEMVGDSGQCPMHDATMASIHKGTVIVECVQ